MALPSGTVTFLFTDVEASTSLWERHPDAMERAMAGHDAALGAAIAASDGHLLKSTGDGVFAVFDRAAAAVTSAVAGLRSLLGAHHETVGVLPVRMGLHTGEGVERDGDYFGTAVNRAARIAGAARGGQILCSAATHLVAHEGTDGYGFSDLGVFHLRGLAEPEHVYQVTANGLPEADAPQTAEIAVANNLPATVSDFVGRVADVAGVVRLVEEHRHVTITGAGGVGKTRLALEACRRLGPMFPDGIWFADLSSATTAKAASGVVASTLGVAEEPGRTLDEGIARFLANKRLLLVLDNCEQALEPVRSAADSWLRAAPRIHVLATSRELMGGLGEAVWPLSPLGHGAGGDEAVQLFVGRAEAVNPRLDIGAHLDDIAELCSDLDGVPLAIELAAARVTALTPAQIGDRISRQFGILSRRGDDQRHGSLEAAIEWSHGLLDDDERRLFAGLAVFPAGFDLGACEDVAPAMGIDEWAAAETLTSLVDKSLVAVEPGPAGYRYRYLETIRRFALERLTESGGTRAAKQALGRWAVGRFGVDAEWPDHDNRSWAVLMTERRNLEEALESMAEHGGGADMVRLAVSLEGIWWWIAWQEGLTWIERILARPDLEPADRALMLCGAATLEWSSGRQERAMRFLDAAEAICSEGAFEFPAQGMMCKSLIYAFDDQPELAMDFAERVEGRVASERAAASTPTPLTTEGSVDNALLWAAIALGQTERAVQLAERVLAFGRTSGNPSIHANALLMASVVARWSRAGEAVSMCDDAIALAESAGSVWWQASANLHRSYALLMNGESAAALASFATATRLTRETGDLRAFASAVEGVASLLEVAGLHREATQILAGAIEVRERLGSVAGLRIEVAHRDRLRSRLQERLGGEYQDLWAAGRQLPMEALADLVQTSARRATGLV